MKVENFATKEVLTIGPDEPIDTAIALMDSHHFHHLPVVNDGSVVGMVSDRDLLLSVGWQSTDERHVSRRARTVVGPLRVREVMSEPAVTLAADAALPAAAQLMLEREIHAVPLVSGGRLAGLVTSMDLLRRAAALSDSEPLLRRLREVVGDHMRASVLTVRPEDEVESAVALMHRHHIQHVPVAVGDTLLGMISDRDVRRACGLELIEDGKAQESGRFYIGSSQVSEIMTRGVLTIGPEAALREAAETMVQHRIGALPVIEEHKLAGIITSTDILRVLAAVPV